MNFFLIKSTKYDFHCIPQSLFPSKSKKLDGGYLWDLLEKIFSFNSAIIITKISKSCCYIYIFPLPLPPPYFYYIIIFPLFSSIFSSPPYLLTYIFFSFLSFFLFLFLLSTVPSIFLSFYFWLLMSPSIYPLLSPYYLTHQTIFKTNHLGTTLSCNKLEYIIKCLSLNFRCKTF